MSIGNVKRCSPPSASTLVYTVGVEKHPRLQVKRFLQVHVNQTKEVKMLRALKYGVAVNYVIDVKQDLFQKKRK